MKKTIILITFILGAYTLLLYSGLQMSKAPKRQFKTEEQALKVALPMEKVSQDNGMSASVIQTEMEIITLTPQNTIVFRGPVTGASVATFQKNILEKSNSLGKNETIYMVIDSPGGSVIDGNYLIDTVKALPQKVKTISIFSASMAFQMVQNFEERLVTPSGILMSHRASGGFEGEFGGDGKGELITRLNWILQILKTADEKASLRMSLSVTDYQNLIRDEYWVSGQNAVKDRAADRTVLIKCSNELLEKVETVTIRSFFGSATMNFSGCPIIAYPINVKMEFNHFIADHQKQELENFINKLILDKRTFVKDYIITNKIESIVK